VRLSGDKPLSLERACDRPESATRSVGGEWLLCHGVDQGADPFDLNSDHFPGTQIPRRLRSESHTRRSAGADQITGLQCHGLGDVAKCLTSHEGTL